MTGERKDLPAKAVLQLGSKRRELPPSPENHLFQSFLDLPSLIAFGSTNQARRALFFNNANWQRVFYAKYGITPKPEYALLCLQLMAGLQYQIPRLPRNEGVPEHMLTKPQTYMNASEIPAHIYYFVATKAESKDFEKYCCAALKMDPKETGQPDYRALTLMLKKSQSNYQEFSDDTLAWLSNFANDSKIPHARRGEAHYFFYRYGLLELHFLPGDAETLKAKVARITQLDPLAHLNRACELKYPDAHHAKAQRMLTNTKESKEEYGKLMYRAATLGQPDACLAYGISILDFDGLEADPKLPPLEVDKASEQEAVRFLEIASTHNYFKAHLALAAHYYLENDLARAWQHAEAYWLIYKSTASEYYSHYSYTFHQHFKFFFNLYKFYVQGGYVDFETLEATSFNEPYFCETHEYAQKPYKIERNTEKAFSYFKIIFRLITSPVFTRPFSEAPFDTPYVEKMGNEEDDVTQAYIKTIHAALNFCDDYPDVIERVLSEMGDLLLKTSPRFMLSGNAYNALDAIYQAYQNGRGKMKANPALAAKYEPYSKDLDDDQKENDWCKRNCVIC